MGTRKAALLTAGALAAVLVPLAASPAAAAGASASCSVTGGTGSASWTWVSRTKINPLTITVKDTKADGYHPAVRLVTYTGSTVKHWSWHHVYGGNGASETWHTSAEDSRGIKHAGVEVQLYDGSTEVNKAGLTTNCYSGGKFNPLF
ncbi:hypothetical protein AB0I98_26055 [Streptomyces sp. NPDC050211]|uniref:hypothetical protein n=1 Tax=Streptomyces sp. NPDC050211 TaxID=3154932 RepID=UPI003434FEA9